jgi:4-carboxymuconolactone decarboxylase
VGRQISCWECTLKLLTATTFATLLCSAAVGADQAQSRPDPKPSSDVLEITPQLYRYTTELLFGDVWKREALSPRDRSLVTVAALVAQGQAAQLPFHLNRAMDNGLTREQAAEVVTHLACYVGWPKAMSAVPVLKDVFAGRA